jgi:hypothetical protein
LQDIGDSKAQGFVKMMMTENLTAERAVAAAQALGPKVGRCRLNG